MASIRAVDGGDADCAPGPVRAQPLPRTDAEDLALVFRALADPTRLQLVAMIDASPDGEACVCDLVAQFDTTQPTISHHLKVLTAAGLLERDKRGQWAWYSLVPGRVEPIRPLLSQVARPAMPVTQPSRC